MSNVTPLYNTHITCPVCQNKVEYTKVRTKAIRVIKRDTDFCPWYEGENPVLYEAVICPECGYGAHISSFDKINKYEIERIKERITSRWHKRNFSGQRTIDEALEAYKIVLLNLNEREAPKSEIAKICLRIAWLYRYKNEKANENKFLKFSLENYKLAYSQEDLSLGKFDEFTCIFIIGELEKRLGNYNESRQWLSRLIMSYSDPLKKSRVSPKLIKSAREIIQEMKQLGA
jgi:uncharacterized protein (DUF2225 family)